MLSTFVLLGLSICAVWLPDIKFGRSRTLPPWLPLFIAAALSGFACGILAWPALLALATLAGVSAFSARTESRALRTLLSGITALLALALALHFVPGFDNPIIVAQVQVSNDAAPFTQYANFDKGAAGLLLLVFFCQRVTRWDGWRRLAAPTVIAAAATAAAVLIVAWAIGTVRPDPKLPAFALAFLSVNLLFTCVAEEAFFRGLLQERLTRRLAAQPRFRWVPVAASSALFGAAHFAGGPTLVLLATIGGVGYSLVYAVTRRVEAAVLTHFAVNAVHFFGFTYPHLQM